MKILLASASPRRKSLLSGYGFDIEIIKPDFCESSVSEKEPSKLVCLLAEGKMDSIDTKGALALSADTVVAYKNNILGKPKDAADAFEMLSMLSGNTHTVYTGVCISCDNEKIVFCEKSDVTFYPLTEHQINEYIKTGCPFDKAGSYGIQDDMGIAFVKTVSGEISNVIGLPMGRVIAEIERIAK